jgi:hypothetical protein
MTPDEFELDPELPLRKAPERAIGVYIPTPLSKRLDLLVELLERAGIRAFRKDLVAALILAAPESEDDLSRLVISYRKAASREAALGENGAAQVLELRPDKPGRRPRRG